MTREEALKWFRNRKDDAFLIDSVYLERCGGDRESGAKLLRRFTRNLLQADRDATLREFLRHFNSDDPYKRQMAEDEVSAFGDGWSRSVLEGALNILVEHKFDDIEGGADEFNRSGRSGTRPRALLPPDDAALIDLLEDAERARAKAKAITTSRYSSVATQFAIALLEKGIGGLSEWLSMQRGDASPQDKARAKELLEMIRPKLLPGSIAKHKLFATLRHVQALAGVDRTCTIKSIRSRPVELPRLARPRKRQWGEGSSVPTLDGGPVCAEAASVPPGFALVDVPRRPRTARMNVNQPQHDMDEGQAPASLEVEASQSPVKEEPPSVDESAPVPIYVEGEMLDQGRTPFYREVELCDLSGDMADWRLHLNTKDAAVVRHRPDPIPENDDKFPLRDPDDPLRRVHPRYAGPDGKCHPKVQVRDVQLGSGFRSYFRDF
jgi:hypothetical protein